MDGVTLGLERSRRRPDVSRTAHTQRLPLAANTFVGQIGHAASISSSSLDVGMADQMRSMNTKGTDVVLGTARNMGLDPIAYVSSYVALFPPGGQVLTPRCAQASGWWCPCHNVSQQCFWPAPSRTLVRAPASARKTCEMSPDSTAPRRSLPRRGVSGGPPVAQWGFRSSRRRPRRQSPAGSPAANPTVRDRA